MAAQSSASRASNCGSVLTVEGSVVMTPLRPSHSKPGSQPGACALRGLRAWVAKSSASTGTLPGAVTAHHQLRQMQPLCHTHPVDRRVGDRRVCKRVLEDLTVLRVELA